MTQRVKTIEYAFDSRTTTLGPATRYDFTQITLYAPETTSRTIRSAVIVHTCRDNETAGGAFITSFLLGIKLGAVAFNDSTVTGNIDQFSIDTPRTWTVTRDVTSYFVTNFGSGASQTCQVGVQWGGVDTINHTAKLILTYEYDDSGQDTRVKTVRIPLDGTTTTLTNTLTELGTNQVPNLDSFLPEASKVYRKVWFEVCANEVSQATTDFQLGLSLDAEGEVNDGSHEQALNGSPFYRFVWVRDDMTTNATHAFKARSTVTGRFGCCNVILCVTYEYSHTSSTSIINSLYFPLNVNSGFIGYNSINSRYETKFFVEETTPALVQSGVYLSYSLASDEGSMTGLQAKAGGQSYRSYTMSYATFERDKGQYMLSQRIDSGGASGAGMTLARGENTFTLDVQHSSQTDLLGNVGAVLILNYTSDKHANGDGVHNHSTCWSAHSSSMVSTSADNSNVGMREEISTFAPIIPESAFWVTTIGFVFYYLTGGLRVPFTLVAEVKSGEGKADGWLDVLNGMGYVQSEAQEYNMINDSSRFYTRNPADADTNRLAVETSRTYRLSTNQESIVGGMMWLTHHGISYSIQGTASNYAGDGSGITVRLYRSDTNEFVASTTTVAGGGFTMTWYDNTINMFVEGREDSTHRGRSDNQLAV